MYSSGGGSMYSSAGGLSSRGMCSSGGGMYSSRDGGIQSSSYLPAPSYSSMGMYSQASTVRPSSASAGNVERGGLVGLGLGIDSNGDEARVSHVVPGYAAFVSGQVQKGDIVEEIDGHKMALLGLHDVNKLCLGPEGSRASLLMKRGTQRFTAQLQRVVPMVQPGDGNDVGAGIRAKLQYTGPDVIGDMMTSASPVMTYGANTMVTPPPSIIMGTGTQSPSPGLLPPPASPGGHHMLGRAV